MINKHIRILQSLNKSNTIALPDLDPNSNMIILAFDSFSCRSTRETKSKRRSKKKKKEKEGKA